MAATGGAGAKNVEFDANCAARLANLEQRLYQKANEGPDALRRFVWIRRSIFQLDGFETGTWIDEVNAARANCLKERARTLASSQAANQQVEISSREWKTIDAPRGMGLAKSSAAAIADVRLEGPLSGE